MADATLQSKLGYSFQNQALLTQALTHRSHGSSNNERLEYLGDSILGFFIAETLFTRFPQYAEGDLTRMRARLVCQETLAEQARSVDLPACLLLGDGELKSGGHRRDSTLADALEAVIGAIYLDSDMPTVAQVLRELFATRLQQISPHTAKDPKTQLQEHLQKLGLPLPHYAIIETAGQRHALTFTVACSVDPLSEPITAAGTSRRMAEQNAAQAVLSRLGVLDAGDD